MSTDNNLQKASPAYRLPALDPDFLLGDSMRGDRLQLEYEKAEELLPTRVFPSTLGLLCRTRVRLGDRSAHWYEQARRFGLIVSECGGAFARHDGIRDNVITTGGEPGITE